MRLWFVLIAVLGFGWSNSKAEDWPQWRGPNRDGISWEKVLATWPVEGPKTLWRASVGTGFSSLSISQGRLYTMGNTNDQDAIWCLDALTGKQIWQHIYTAQLGPQYYEGGPGSTPTVEGGCVFTISKWGDVFCLDAVKGTVIWQRDLRQEGLKPNRWGYAGSPLIWHDLVFLNAGATGTALDRKTGRTIWSTGTNVTGYASPVLTTLGGKEILLIFAAKHLVALEPRTGRELWRYPWETGYDTNNSDPLVHREQIFISSYSRGCALLAIKEGQPEIVYENKHLHSHLSAGILLGDSLYSFNGEAKQKETDLRCLDLPSGEVQWEQKAPAFGSMICAAGKLIVLSEKGELLLVEASAEAFKPLARAQVMGGLCWTPPALANGVLYVRNAKGELVGLDLRIDASSAREPRKD